MKTDTVNMEICVNKEILETLVLSSSKLQLAMLKQLLEW